MPYAIKLNNDRVEVVHAGRLGISELTEARQQAADALARNSMTRMLVDLRDADMSSVSVTDAFKFNATHHTVLGQVAGLRIASLVRPEHLQISRFSETVALNRGMEYRVFATVDGAVEWLTKD